MRVRSFYAGTNSFFEKYAKEFDKNPVPTKFQDTDFYKYEQNDKYTSDVQAFAYFDLDENRCGIIPASLFWYSGSIQPCSLHLFNFSEADACNSWYTDFIELFFQNGTENSIYKVT